jgi:excisionase family DNA binding protein
MPERSLVHPQWLTLEQASKRLGIHPTTLRRWADEGAIHVFVTPGGHRRFVPADLERFVVEHQHGGLTARSEPSWADHAIAQARESVRDQRWLATYDDSERESQRHLGQRLMGLVLQYIAHPNDNPQLLAEARGIGVQHAQNAIRGGRSLPELLQAISFFRTTLLEVALQESPQGGKGRSDANVHLLRRIERLVGEVQSGVVELYLGEGQEQ